jgi:hypothetical protein
MATYAQIELTFNEDLVAGDNLTFFYGFGQSIFETWVNLRTAPNQVTVGTPTANFGERSAINYVQAISLDFAYLGMEITRSVNVVTIKATNPLYQFGFLPGQPTVDVSYIIDNTTEDLLYISGVTFSAATTNKCANVKVNVTTNVLADKVTSPVTINPNTNNPFSFDYIRETTIPITVESTGGQVYTLNKLLPSVLSSSNITVQVNTSPQGSTAIINVSQNGLLTLEYSLDNITFQSSNVFPSLVPGDYTVWVRDQLGCKVSKAFEANEFGILSPYFRISESNSWRFINRITWGNCANYKNDENTLSCEENVPIPYRWIYDNQVCDIITIQFQSNYPILSALAIEVGGSGIAPGPSTIPIVQLTENIGRKDSRDAIKYPFLDYTGVYFTSGNIYDFDTGVDTGEDYTLNGGLPIWAVPGNYFKMDGAWFLIEQIAFDDIKNVELILVSGITQPLTDEATIVSSIFNLEVFEEYEFTIDLVDWLDKTIQIELRNNSTYFDNLLHVSEWINIKTRQKQTVQIEYFHRENTDQNFSRGLVNKLRMPLEVVGGKPKQESETLTTDNSAYLLDSDVHKVYLFEFQPVTTGIMFQLVKALSHSDVRIDGVYYVKEGDIEVEGPLEETNLYIVKAPMIKARNVYNSDSSNLGFGEGSIEIPGLVDGGSNNYVKYN